MPCRLSRWKMWPRQGLLTIDTIGFGRLIVSGLRRLPSPPAMTTACIRPSLGAFRGLLCPDGEERLEVVAGGQPERHVRVGARDAPPRAHAAGGELRAPPPVARAGPL